jgi:hypothetical protein
MLVALLVAGAGACGAGDEHVAVGSSSGPVCSNDLGATGPIEALGFSAQGPEPQPADWAEPLQQGFDWDGDGRADSLEVDGAAAEVRLEWADGSLVVTGVPSDFGPDQVDVPVVPAAVADVTGDEQLDLVVAARGTAAVVVGGGAGRGAQEVAFSAIGEDVAGWRSPPLRLSLPGRPALDVPFATGTVKPMWDITGDGIDDFRVYSEVRRAEGPAAFYAGRDCTA